MFTKKHGKEVQMIRYITPSVEQAGVKADPFEAIALAEKYGYESVTPLTDAMLRYSDARLQRLKEKMDDAALDDDPAAFRFQNPQN